MILPFELVDEILTHLQHDKRALANCSLVAKSWTYPSQRLLFAFINLIPENHKAWQKNGPQNAEMMQYVRTLTCSGSRSFRVLHDDHSRSFYRLQYLALQAITPIESNALNLFLAFRDTLSSLSLEYVSLTWSTFVGLINYFPNLRELLFHDSSLETDHSPIPPLSRPLRGTLCLSTLSASHFSTLSRGIAGLEPEYDRLEIIHDPYQPFYDVQHIISACEKTLTYLMLGLWADHRKQY